MSSVGDVIAGKVRRETRRLLVDAAIDMFATTEFGAVTLTAVSKAAGVSNRIAKYHFATHEALFVEVYRNWSEVEAQAVRLCFSLAAHGEIDEAVDGLISFYAEPDRILISAAAAFRFSPAIKEAYKEALLYRTFSAANVAPGFDAQPQGLKPLIVSQIEKFAQHVADDFLGTDRDAGREMLATMLRDAVSVGCDVSPNSSSSVVPPVVGASPNVEEVLDKDDEDFGF